MNSGTAPRVAGETADLSLAIPEWITRIRAEVGNAIVGQTVLIDRLLAALLTGGHVMLEGLPGMAKTLVVRSLAQACAASFQRIQFTPDLLPADVIGTLIYDPRTLTFTPHRGPIFAHLVLADEINRAPAKVQSALLEAMQDRSVTIGRETHRLEEPFLVMATQNPREQHGTFPLPEAQLDRFLFKISVGYPTRTEELEVLTRHLAASQAEVRPVASVADITSARESVRRVFVEPSLIEYVLDIVRATREPSTHGAAAVAASIRHGASPRAAAQFLAAACATAFLAGRAFVLPADIRTIAPDVLRHRVVLSYDAEISGVSVDEVVAHILSVVAAP